MLQQESIGKCPSLKHLQDSDDRDSSNLQNSELTRETVSGQGDAFSMNFSRPLWAKQVPHQATTFERATRVCQSEGIAEQSMWKLLQVFDHVDPENGRRLISPTSTRPSSVHDEKTAIDIDIKKAENNDDDGEVPRLHSDLETQHIHPHSKMWRLRATLAVIAGVCQQSLCW